MAYSCDIATDSALLADSVKSSVLSILQGSTATFATAVVIAVGTPVHEIAALNDSVIEANFAVVTETVHVRGTAYPVLHGVNIVRDQARAQSRVFDQISDTARESATLNDSVSHLIASVVTDVATVRESVTQTALTRTVVTETARLRSRAVQQVAAVLHETAVLADAIFSRAIATDVATDSAAVLGQVQEKLIATTVVIEPFRTRDQVVHVLHAVDIASETAVVVGGVVEPLRGEAWTASTDTFAMSRYTGYRFNSAAVIGGRLYAVGDAGIYALDGATDAGAAVPASLVTGLSDLGDPSQKRVREVFVGYEADGSLAMTVASTGAGAEAAHTYLMPPKTATDPTANRIKVGRGLRSRFWRFTLTNPSGHAFKITEARVEIDNLSRKI